MVGFKEIGLFGILNILFLGILKLKFNSRDIHTRVDNYIKRGSGWVIHKIREIKLKTYTYKPIGGGGGTDVPLLPRWVKSSVRSPKAKGMRSNNKCFVVYILNEYIVKSNVNYYMHKLLNLSKITFPVNLYNIERFEHAYEIGVNIYGLKQNRIIILYITTIKSQKHINLLLFKKHYFVIKNVGNLLRFQIPLGHARHDVILQSMFIQYSKSRKTADPFMCSTQQTYF